MLRFVIYLLELHVWTVAKDLLPAPSIGTDDYISNTIDHCYDMHMSDTVLVNCTAMSLRTVPKLPKNSTIINLDQNYIASITDLPFLGMETLKSVNLSCNPLRYITPELFKGLWNLQRIYFLQCELCNQVDLDYNYLLSDVRNLNEFALTFQHYGCTDSRPINHLSAIKRAQYLIIDGLVMISILESESNTTDAKTKFMTLRNDASSIYSSIQIFRKSMFRMFDGLKSLHIYNTLKEYPMLRVYVEQDTFSQLKHLNMLAITNGVSVFGDGTQSRLHMSTHDWSMDLFMHNISASVSELKHFRELRMEGLNYLRQQYLNCSLALSNLSRSKSLKKLSLNKNSFSLQQCTVFGTYDTHLPKALETLELTENCLGRQDIFHVLAYNTKLKYIDARYQNWCHLPRETDMFVKSARKMLSYSKSKSIVFIESDLQELYFSHCQEPFHYWFESHTRCMFKRLEKLEFTWLKDIRGYSLAVPGDFLIKRPNVRYVDLSGSGITNIDINTFKNIRKLNTLYLSDNHLGKMGSDLSTVLKELPTLVELHLPNNGITDLAENVFCSMNLLKTLDLSRNLLSTLSPSLKYLTSLKLLNISNNKLTTLSQMNRNDLDKISRNSPVIVDFTGNRFLCTCDTLEFSKWVVSTHLRFSRKEQFSCTGLKSQQVFIHKLKYEIATLESVCSSDIALAVACSLGAALCIACFVSALVYKFRWRLRYLYYMAKLSVSNYPDAYERLFEYDAFISYSSDDFNVARTGCIENLEHAKDLRLFIHERDFVPGKAIAYNISVGIHSSKMTIFFLSDAFLSSEWCLYEFNIARMESLYSRRTVMLIVLLEKSIVDKLPVDILDVIRSVTYLEYPEHGDEDDTMVFWNKLADCIGRN